MKRWLLGGMFLNLTVLASCTYLGNSRQHSPDSQRWQETALNGKVAPLLAKKEYAQALALMTWKDHPRSPPAGMQQEYLLAVNGLLEKGEASLAAKEYGEAGHAFARVLAVFPVAPSLMGRVKSSAEQVAARVDICSDKLMEEGLLEYRRGSLANAVRIWKELVAFNPEYRGARKAIETASRQLKALQALEQGGGETALSSGAETTPQ